MLNKIKLLSTIACSVLVLQGCNSGDDHFPVLSEVSSPEATITAATYATYRSSAAGPLFDGGDAVSGSTDLCDVKVHKIEFDTIGGAGESTKSSGVFMQPYGESDACAGDRPVVLYAHGTSTFTSYDLSKFVTDSSNPAAQEALLLLATYASRGYAVIAPNYAGYADSTLGYHPYVDEVQQSAEMIHALEYVKENKAALSADLSSELFITGLSQGGYVAMATHKALQQRGESVTASMPVSGPYAMLNFLDTIIGGQVNGGATTFAPMYLTALEKTHDIYESPSEIYEAPYAEFAEAVLPSANGMSGLPAAALFAPHEEGDTPANLQFISPPHPVFAYGFDDDHLLTDDFRQKYIQDLNNNPVEPEYRIRSLVKDGDLRNWTPAAPMLMCGASNDPVVYFSNTIDMVDYWSDKLPAGVIRSVDITTNPLWPADIAIESVHGTTGVYCGLAGLQYFNGVRAAMMAAQ